MTGSKRSPLREHDGELNREAVRPRGMMLHIGGAKTGSTSLQRGVFLNNPAVHHFGEFGDGVTSRLEEQTILSMLQDDDTFYDHLAARRLFATHAAQAAGRMLIFSSADVLHSNRPALVSHRLAELAGRDSSVLLIVRNQKDAIESYYSGHGAWLKPAPRPYFRAFVRFEDWFDHQAALAGASRLLTFCYWEQVSEFIDKFSREAVSVLAFEDLASGQSEAWATLGNLIQMNGREAQLLFQQQRQRPRLTSNQVRFGRAASYLIPAVTVPDVRRPNSRLPNFLDRSKAHRPSWALSQLRHVIDMYGPGNRKLQETFGLRLDLWQYPGLS